MPLIFHENLSHISNLKPEYNYRLITLPHILFLEIHLAGKNIKIMYFFHTLCAKNLFFLFFEIDNSYFLTIPITWCPDEVKFILAMGEKMPTTDTFHQASFSNLAKKIWHKSV